MPFGRDARCSIDALRGATQDPDARVRKAAEIALAHIEAGAEPDWLA